VVDFGVIKAILCQWLEDKWDHKFLLWVKDPLVSVFFDNPGDLLEDVIFRQSIVIVPFNPTAENMAEHLVNNVGPSLLYDSGVRLVKVVVEETRKCSASYTRES
jgi:6-pyruvoyltetrahydropterin/6-carboxytetrahydropterin synthase